MSIEDIPAAVRGESPSATRRLLAIGGLLAVVSVLVLLVDLRIKQDVVRKAEEARRGLAELADTIADVERRRMGFAADHAVGAVADAEPHDQGDPAEAGDPAPVE